MYKSSVSSLTSEVDIYEKKIIPKAKNKKTTQKQETKSKEKSSKKNTPRQGSHERIADKPVNHTKN